MGISQSLQKARSDHPRFDKVQYGAQSPITVIHLQASDGEIKKWKEKRNRLFGSCNGQLTEEQFMSKRRNYPNLLLVNDKNVRLIRDGFCSESYKILVKLQQTWSTNLMQEITNRKSINRYFSQSQVWLILLNVVSTLVPLHKKSATSILGNLHPTNILVNQYGELLIIGKVSLPKQKDNFQTFKQQRAKSSYVSPQMIGFLSSKSYKQYPHYPSCLDPQKVQAYCLGLTLLSICCLETDLSKLYIPQNSTSQRRVRPKTSRQGSSRHNYANLLNQTYFNQKIHFIQTHYSRMLAMVIKCLLQGKPEDRLSAIQLWSVLLEDKKGYINAMDEKWFQQALQTIEQNHETTEQQINEDTDYTMMMNNNNSPQYPFKQKIKESIGLDFSNIEYQNNNNNNSLNYGMSFLRYDGVNNNNQVMNNENIGSQRDKNKKIMFTYN